ncbi:UNVERIFIED_CONTAM: hypothetical protein GTU68_057457 [Idotea baltica]|nr:hypothetical protein [Idotea baltica]
MGGDLSPGRLLEAYARGIFPWYSDNEPIMWWSPAPRLILEPKELHIAKSMRPLFNKEVYRVTYDTVFDRVIHACKTAFRKDQYGTWITPEMINAYNLLHELGFAHSVEVWQEENLVGGLYGIGLGSCFFGESMFAKASNASKFGFISLVKGLQHLGYDLIDCQTKTKHLVSLGAKEVNRSTFEGFLAEAIQKDHLRGPWTEIPAFAARF